MHEIARRVDQLVYVRQDEDEQLINDELELAIVIP
jgi:hypothetical protein